MVGALDRRLFVRISPPCQILPNWCYVLRKPYAGLGTVERIVALKPELWMNVRKKSRAAAYAKCPTSVGAAAGRSFSPSAGTESGESRSAKTALASASTGADAEADHESAASIGHEPGQTLDEKTVGRAGASAAREVSCWPPGAAAAPPASRPSTVFRG